MKNKIIGTLVLVGVASLAVWAFGAPLWQQPQHKKTATIYRVDLSGAAPTIAQMAAQSVVAGDIVIDTSNESMYIVHNPASGVYTKITAASSLAATNVAMGAGLTLEGDITLQSDEKWQNSSAGTVNLYTTRTNANFVNLWLKTGMASNVIGDNYYATIGAQGLNVKATNTTYSSVRLYADDVTQATEDGSVRVYAYANGANTEIVRINATGLSITNSGGDLYVRDDSYLLGDLTVSGTVTLPDGSLSAADLAAGTALPAVNAAAATNLAGGNIASGNIAAARIATALGTSGASIGGNIPIAAMTNALTAGTYSLSGSHLTSGSVTAGALDPSIVTNVLSAGMALPAVNAAAATNIAGGNIASGNIAAARIATALSTSGASIGGNIPIAAITNAITTGTYSVPNARLDAQLQAWAGYGVDIGSCTGGQIVTYSAIYSATPRISLTYSASPTTTGGVWIAARNTTNFTAGGKTGAAMDYIVIGTR